MTTANPLGWHLQGTTLHWTLQTPPKGVSKQVVVITQLQLITVSYASAATHSTHPLADNMSSIHSRILYHNTHPGAGI